MSDLRFYEKSAQAGWTDLHRLSLYFVILSTVFSSLFTCACNFGSRQWCSSAVVDIIIGFLRCGGARYITAVSRNRTRTWKVTKKQWKSDEIAVSRVYFVNREWWVLIKTAHRSKRAALASSLLIQLGHLTLFWQNTPTSLHFVTLSLFFRHFSPLRVRFRLTAVM